MSVVIDCSVALNWVMPDEASPQADQLLQRVSVSGAVVPLLFRIEVGNGLLTAVRRKRITPEFRRLAFERLDALALEEDRDGPRHIWMDCVDLASKHELTLYDATYLEAARRLGLPLATLDRHLAAAARDCGVAPAWS